MNILVTIFICILLLTMPIAIIISFFISGMTKNFYAISYGYFDCRKNLLPCATFLKYDNKDYFLTLSNSFVSDDCYVIRIYTTCCKRKFYNKLLTNIDIPCSEWDLLPIERQKENLTKYATQALDEVKAKLQEKRIKYEYEKSQRETKEFWEL